MTCTEQLDQAQALRELDSAEADCYCHVKVRNRIRELLGGSSDDVSTAYICASDASRSAGFAPLPASELGRCLDERMEIARSLWDRRHLLAHLDIEYVNFDFPGHPYQQCREAFEFQRPAVEALQALLRRFRIAPLHVLTGRGHHFVWQIRQQSEAFRELSRLGSAASSLQSKYSHPHQRSEARPGRPIHQSENVTPVIFAAETGQSRAIALAPPVAHAQAQNHIS